MGTQIPTRTHTTEDTPTITATIITITTMLFIVLRLPMVTTSLLDADISNPTHTLLDAIPTTTMGTHERLQS